MCILPPQPHKATASLHVWAPTVDTCDIQDLAALKHPTSDAQYRTSGWTNVWPPKTLRKALSMLHKDAKATAISQYTLNPDEARNCPKQHVELRHFLLMLDSLAGPLTHGSYALYAAAKRLEREPCNHV